MLLCGQTQPAAVIYAYELFEMLLSTLDILACMDDPYLADFPKQPGIILGYSLN
jgi:hypothetical protein